MPGTPAAAQVVHDPRVPPLVDDTSLQCPAGTARYYDICADYALFGQSVVTEAQRDLTTLNSAYHAAGVVVYRRPGPDYVYVADTGNNRILGFDHLGACALSGANCTNDLDCPAAGDSCQITPGSPAEPKIILGQAMPAAPGEPLGSCCNRDCNLGFFKAPGPDTLCLLGYPEEMNRAEAWQRLNFAVDSVGNVYVPDAFNDRVLRFNDPMSADLSSGKGDAIADMVWGQPDMITNSRVNGPIRCDQESFNLSQRFFSTLMGFVLGYGGVSIEEHDGNRWLWVSDVFNARVLRFDADGGSNKGAPAQAVVGQRDFSSCSGTCSTLSGPNLCAPIVAGVSPVVDAFGARELWVVNQDHGGFSTRFTIYSEVDTARPDCNTPPCFDYDRDAAVFAGGYKPGCDPAFPSATGCVMQASGFIFDPTYDPLASDAELSGFVWVNEHAGGKRTLLVNRLLDQDRSNDIVTVVNALPVPGSNGVYAEGCDDNAYSRCDGVRLYDRTARNGIRDPRDTNQVRDYRLCWPGGSIGLDDAGNIYLADEKFFRVSRFALPYTYLPQGNDLCFPEANGGLLGPNRIGPSKIGEPVGAAIFSDPQQGVEQFVLKDRQRYLVWDLFANDLLGPVAQSADLAVGQADLTSRVHHSLGTYSYHALTLNTGRPRMWASLEGDLGVFDLPLTAGQQALDVGLNCAGCAVQATGPLRRRLQLYRLNDAGVAIPIPLTLEGVAVEQRAGQPVALWVSDYIRNRVMRVSNFTQAGQQKLLVDMVLGQVKDDTRPDGIGSQCNREGTPGTPPAANRLCRPHYIGFDRYGNLYVVESTYECRDGNKRILMFRHEDLAGATAMFPDLAAAKVFVANDFTTPGNCTRSTLGEPTAPLTVTFSLKNEMIVAGANDNRNGPDFYLSQVHYYRDPLATGPMEVCKVARTPCASSVDCPPADTCVGRFIQGQKPDGYLRVPTGAPGEVVFGPNDELVLQDHTWSRAFLLRDIAPWLRSWERNPDQDAIVGLTDTCPYVSNPTNLDSNADGQGDACTCSGDCDHDGTVSQTEADWVLSAALGWAQPSLAACPLADFDGSGDISVVDVINATAIRDRGCPPGEGGVASDGGRQATVTIGSVTGATGQSVNVPIYLQESSVPRQAAGLQFDLEFDPAVLTAAFSNPVCQLNPSYRATHTISVNTRPGAVRLIIADVAGAVDVMTWTSAVPGAGIQIASCAFLIQGAASSGVHPISAAGVEVVDVTSPLLHPVTLSPSAVPGTVTVVRQGPACG